MDKVVENNENGEKVEDKQEDGENDEDKQEESIEIRDILKDFAKKSQAIISNYLKNQKDEIIRKFAEESFEVFIFEYIFENLYFISYIKIFFFI